MFPFDDVIMMDDGGGGGGGGLDRVIATPWYQYFSYIQSDTFHLMRQGYFVSILL